MSDDDMIRRIAATMWKAEVVDTGTPQSVADARTPEAFADESEYIRNKWMKFARIAMPAATPTLAVWYGSMPESNGRKNWTASLHRKGGDAHLDGFCFARSEYPERVRYEADRVRWIGPAGP